ncbi:M6 family metalloprotease domain-containing protein [Cohnella sp.]|uniref:M6 family metalloprotease domain-containing protein n=1 Tax=Cohnella sp. TaxID=1883426 RepID=UPI003564B2E4
MLNNNLAPSPLFRNYHLYVFILASLFLLLSIGGTAEAAPAAPFKALYTQPDGTTFYAEKHGDETFNWTAASDDIVIAQSLDGYWYYAEIQSRQLVAGTVKYAVQLPPPQPVTSRDVASLYQYYGESKRAEIIEGLQSSQPSRAPIFDGQDIRTSQDLSAPHPLLVLLVSFNDVSLSTTQADWQNLIFGTSGKTLNNYYKEASNNQFYFSPANETDGSANDGIITVALDRNHPNTRNKTNNVNRVLVQQALNAANSQVDFASYDKNNDKYVSMEELHIMTIIAGQEAAYGDPEYADIPSVWAHHWVLSDFFSPVIDDVKLLSIAGGGGYTQFGEKQGNHQATIGTIAHELGHDLDLPDLYDVFSNNGNTNGVGSYSIMGSGNWASLIGEHLGATPVHFDAWSKIFLGFENPIDIPYGTDIIATLHANNITNPDIYNIYKIKTGIPDEYFLLENRQYGIDNGFDQSLQNFASSGGIAIWHIDMNKIRQSNYQSVNDTYPKGVDLEGYDNFPGNPFYHDGYVFNMYSVPNSSYNADGTPSGISILDSQVSSNMMTIKAGTGPAFTAIPIVSSSSTSLTYTTQWNEAATVYYEVLPAGATPPDLNNLLEGKDSLGNPVTLSGHLSAGAGTPSIIAVNGLTVDTSYDLYLIGVDENGHLGDSIVHQFLTAVSPALIVGSVNISEAAANDGSITTPQTVTVTDSTFDSTITKADVTINNLPDGLDYTVTLTSPTVLTIAFTSKATNHMNANSLSDVSVSVAQAKIVGASSNVTSNTFSIGFSDPIPKPMPVLTADSATISEAAANDGSITAAQTVTVSNGTFDPAIAKADVTIINLPAGLDYTVTLTSPTVLNIAFTGNATNHANANDVNNVTVTVAQAKIVEASSDISSNAFSIDFQDPIAPPPPITITIPSQPSGPQVSLNGSNGVIISQVKPELGKDKDGTAAETWIIDSPLLQKAIDFINDADESVKRIEIPITLPANTTTTVELPAEVLSESSKQTPAIIISLVSDRASYDLPVNVLDWKAITQSLGADLKDTKINVTLKLVAGKLAEEIAQKAQASGLKVLGTSVEFSVTVTGNGNSKDITDYGSNYIARTITLNQSVNALIPSVVVYEPQTGKLSFVPATFSVADGKTFVTIKRNGNSIYTVIYAYKTFADIQNHWARREIELLASKTLIKGVTENAFAPDQMITRAEFVTLLAQALGIREDLTKAGFTDVKETDWFAGYVGASVQAGLVNGFIDGTFRPNDKITREQIAVMIVNAIKFAQKDTGDRASQGQVLARFNDQASISPWAKDAVSFAVEAGIISGMKSDTFQPTNLATRAQTASIMKRLLVHLRFID